MSGHVSLKNLALPFCMAMLSMPLAAQSIPLVASQWQVTGAVSFVQKEAFPQGLMQMTAASNSHQEPYARWRSADFANGTIEFDVKPLNDEWPTVRFRIQPNGDAEEFYIRPSGDCSVAIDCLQYAPKMRGRMLWDSHYQDQVAAPFMDNAWNHVRLVISGQRMQVYINRAVQPDLVVGQLQGPRVTGALELQGPAVFANVRILPGATDGLAGTALPDPTANDAGYVRAWRLHAPTALSQHDLPALADMPTKGDGWSGIEAERLGTINLARRFDPASDRKTPAYAWLSVTVHADHAGSRAVSLGFLRMATVFVNGRQVFAGANLYNTPASRQAPDGRLGLDNAHFAVPLQAGDNRIVVALRSNTPEIADRYSYALRFHFDDARGLRYLTPGP